MTRERERFLADMAGHAEDIADRAAAEVAASIEAYRGAGPAIAGGVREVVLRTYLRLLGAWRDGRVAAPAEIERLVDIAVPPVEARISMEDALHTYRIAAQIIWREFRRVALSHPRVDRTFLLDAADLGYQYLNDLSTSITQRFVEAERHRLQRRGDAERALIESLLADPPRHAEAVHAADALGLDLAGTWWAVVARPRGIRAHPADALASALGDLRRLLLVPGRRAAIATLEGQAIALVCGEYTPPEASSDRSSHVVAGIGRPNAGPDGIRLSYGEAVEALDIAIRKDDPIVRFDDAWLDRFFIGSISATELARTILAPLRRLPGDRRRLWEATLEAYLDAGGSIARASKVLHLHPQSVRYRLSRLQQLLGSRLGTPEERLALHVAIKSSHLFVEDGPEP